VTEFGYAGKILTIDLSSGRTASLPTADYADRFLGGKTTFEAADHLKAELGKAMSVLSIGPAAENLVCFATMLTDDGASGASGLGHCIQVRL
jgi:aldehyde:ferredoxin oxidoreductase